MIRSWPLAAVMLGMLFLGSAGTSRATMNAVAAGDTTLLLDDAAPSRSLPWWSGFDDDVLNGLIGSARLLSSSGPASKPLDAEPAEIGVAIAYVLLRVQALAQTYLENSRSAITRQLELMIASNPEHDDFIKELSRRKARVDDAIRKINAQRDVHIVLLAARCGMSEADLSDLIDAAPADPTRALPRFLAPVPSALPMALLANRDDVHLAAALYGIDSAVALDGAIIAADEANGGAESDGVAAALSGHPLYDSALAQARGEVSEALNLLQERDAIANADYKRARDLKVEFEVAKKRRDRGEMSEVQLMEEFQVLSQHLQTLTVANGNLAIAWIALMGRLGNGTSIDITSPSYSTVHVSPGVSQKPRNP